MRNQKGVFMQPWINSCCMHEAHTYLSTPWRPAALFDLPNHGGHQEQGQEAAEDRREDESNTELIISSWDPYEFMNTCTFMCVLVWFEWVFNHSRGLKLKPFLKILYTEDDVTAWKDIRCVCQREAEFTSWFCTFFLLFLTAFPTFAQIKYTKNKKCSLHSTQKHLEVMKVRLTRLGDTYFYCECECAACSQTCT